MYERIDELGAAVIAESRSAGLVIGIAREDNVEHCNAFGSADLAAARAMTNESIFRIGSITKSITASLVLEAVERGQLGLDEDIATYLPEVSLRDANDARVVVTVRQLLHHISGIREYVVDPSFHAFAASGLSVERMIEFISMHTLEFAPGTQWAYSNANYVLLAAALERVSGSSYADLVASQMKRANVADLFQGDDTDLERPRAAKGYTLVDGALHPAPHIHMIGAFGAGSLCGTAQGLMSWMQRVSHHAIGPRDTFRLMYTPPLLPSGAQPGYGLGFQIERIADHWRIGHSGGIAGFSSHLGYFGSAGGGVTIVVLANTDTANAPAIATAIAEIMFA